MTPCRVNRTFEKRIEKFIWILQRLHVYSLDKEEKMMLVPGKDVVVDSTASTG